LGLPQGISVYANGVRMNERQAMVCAGMPACFTP
jgi:hypothetical protein